MAADSQQLASDLLVRFRDQARRKPALFVGGALGAGLLAGGAIAPRVLGRLAALAGALAWRSVVLPMIKERVLAALEPSSDQPGGEDDEAERYRQRQHP